MILIISIIISISLWIIYGIHLHYKEQIDTITKEYEEIINLLEQDLGYKEQVFEKRVYRKQIDKLKQELEKKNLLIEYMTTYIRESRLYKKYFIHNNKKNESNN